MAEDTANIERHVRFFGCIGNPPYQEDRDTTKDMPMYDTFMDAVFDIADKVELVTPARFLFDAGATPKAWNKKMREDPHFKVHHFESDSTKMFPRASIKGGVAITYHDTTKEFEPVGVFTPFDELNSILRKVKNAAPAHWLSESIYPYSSYTLSDKLWEDYPALKEEAEYVSKHRNEMSVEEKAGKLSNTRIITTNIFDLLPDLFFESVPDDGEEYCGLIGRKDNQRCCMYIRKRYINTGANHDKWKVILPKANGSGALGEVLTTPMIGTPMIGYTQTFISIGSFDTEDEANACLKYVKTKFARTMLGVLKITQDNPAPKWRYVPLQDFTAASDIDWSQSIADIDRQLYEKYGLDENEVAFIEQHVKEMN